MDAREQEIIKEVVYCVEMAEVVARYIKRESVLTDSQHRDMKVVIDKLDETLELLK